MHHSVRSTLFPARTAAVLAIAAASAPPAAGQGTGPTPACALLSVAEIRELPGGVLIQGRTGVADTRP